MADNLRALRNNFYLGNHQFNLDEEPQIVTIKEKSYFYRSLLEVDSKALFARVTDKSPAAHQAIKLLGTYREAKEEETKELVFETMVEWLGDEILKDDETLQMVAAQMYFEQQSYKEAMQCIADPGENLEKLAMHVQIFLKIDRVDLAVNAAKSMGDIDDDDALTQLATAWLYVYQGGDKVTEASFLYQELIDKFGTTAPLLESLAVCQLHLGNASAAFTQLKQARSMAITANQKASIETLVNSIVCMLHMHKNEIVPKVMGEVKALESPAANAWLSQQDKMEAMFDKAAAQYSC